MRHRKGLGDLPVDYRRTGDVITPGAGLALDWENRFTLNNFPFVVGLTSIQVIPANPLRAYLLIQNKDAAANMFVSFGTNATAFNAAIIVPEGNYEFIGGENGGSFVPNNSVYVLGTVAGQSGVVLEGVLPPAVR